MADSAMEALAQGEEIDGAPETLSIEEELRATRTKLKAKRKPKKFKLPGYDKLQMEYAVIDYESIKDNGEKVAEQLRSEQIDDPLLMGMCDTLIQSAVCAYVEVDGQLRPLHELPGYEGGPVRWGDERIARMVGLDKEEMGALRGRHIVRGVIADDALVVEHGQDVSRWIERARRNVNSDF